MKSGSSRRSLAIGAEIGSGWCIGASCAAASQMAYPCKTSAVLAMDALLTLSSKGQLVIPARLRQLLGFNPGDR